MQTSDINPSWLKNAFVRFSQETTCQNEWELLGMTSQLHRDPGLIPSLDALLASIKSSLPETATILSGTFVMLSYDEGIGIKKRAMAPMYAPLGCSAIGMEEIRGLPADSDVGTLDFARSELLRACNGQSDSIGILQLPYFILKRDDLLDNSSFEDYRNLFFDGNAIFSTPRYVRPGEDQGVLIEKHTIENCYQRFVLLLALPHEDRWSCEFNNLELAADLGALLGSCLTWAGKSVADSTRWIMAAYAVRIANFSHEAGKALIPFERLLPKDPDTVKQYEELKMKLTIPTLGELLTAEDIRRGAAFSDGYARPSLAKMLEIAIADCGSYEDGLTADRLFQNEPLLVTLKIEDVHNRKVQLEIRGLHSDQQITFDQRSFNRLVRNILRNAAQHSIIDQTPVMRLTVTVRERADFLEIDILNKGTSTVSVDLARRLFRTPVPSTSSGLGLYTIGLMFEAQRLPAPRAYVNPEGLHFQFRFPRHVQ